MDFSQINKDVNIQVCDMPSIDEIKYKLSPDGLLMIFDLANYFDIFPYADGESELAKFEAPTPMGPYRSLRAEYGQPNIMLVGQTHATQMFRKVAPNGVVWVDDFATVYNRN